MGRLCGFDLWVWEKNEAMFGEELRSCVNLELGDTEAVTKWVEYCR